MPPGMEPGRGVVLNLLLLTHWQVSDMHPTAMISCFEILFETNNQLFLKK